MRLRALAPLLLVLVALALGLAACGGDDEGAPADGGGGGGGGQTLQLAADPSGAAAYDQTELTASAGEITIEFTNDSGVGHDVVIEGTDARTEIISEGSDSLTTTLEPGEYVYFCSVPGHREAGMEGTLTVE